MNLRLRTPPPSRARLPEKTPLRLPQECGPRHHETFRERGREVSAPPERLEALGLVPVASGSSRGAGCPTAAGPEAPTILGGVEGGLSSTRGMGREEANRGTAAAGRGTRRRSVGEA